ncbi:MAG TPA: ATP-dependent DNA helicase, partial [Nitrospiria bacterium]
ITTGFRVLSRPEQVIFFQDHLFDFDLDYYRPLGNPTKHVEALLTLFSRAKDEDITPAEYQQFARKARAESEQNPGDASLTEFAREQEEIARVYETYQALLIKEGFVDFGDLVHLPLQLFRAHPLVLKHYQERFRHILVDEFQDTNYAQFQIVRLLADRLKNIAVVGDDDQSIYKFRGAAISNILNFMTEYPGARQVVLTENHRSTAPVLEQSYRLIKNNDPDRLEVRNRIDKRLRSNRKGSLPVIHLPFDTVSAEADAVARSVEEKVDTGGYAYRDFALLLRANQDAEPFLRAFNMRRIPYYFSGNRGLYRREEIRSLLSFMRVLAGPLDSLSLFGLASSEIYGEDSGLDMETLIRCNQRAERKNRPLEQVFEAYDKETDTGTPAGQTGDAALRRIVGDIRMFRKETGRHPASLLLYRFIQHTGYLEKLTRTETLEAELKIKNIGEFFEKIRRIETVLETDRLPHVVRYLNGLIEAGDDPSVAEIETDRDVVNVLTVHKAKGLEFRVVFMAGLVEQKFPTRVRKDPIELPRDLIKDTLPEGDFHLQEERRLFYVGMTRAREELYLTSAVDYGGKPRRASRFISESLGINRDTLPVRRSGGLEMIRRSESPGAGPNTAPYHPAESPTLSYYKIDDYLTCPLKYKFSHVIRPPVRRPPAVMYGSALHAAVQAYLKQRMEGRTLAPAQVIEVFEGAWVNDGFLSRGHEEKRLEAGRDTIKRFIRAEEEAGEIPAAVEKGFKFFAGETRVTGRWDRIDQAGGVVRITDYKSSQVRSMKKAESEIRKSLQLSIYALAYFHHSGKLPDQVSLYFLDSGIAAFGKRSAKDLAKTTETIQAVASGIQKGDFSARPSYLACRYCTYNEICPHTGFGKEEKKKTF